jgi:hypothetical protein
MKSKHPIGSFVWLPARSILIRDSAGSQIADSESEVNRSVRVEILISLQVFLEASNGSSNECKVISKYTMFWEHYFRENCLND